MYFACNHLKRIGDRKELNEALPISDHFGPFSTLQHAKQYLEWYRCELGVGVDEEHWFEEGPEHMLLTLNGSLAGEVIKLEDPLKQIW